MSPRLTVSEAPAQGCPSKGGASKRSGQASELRKTLKPLMEKRRRARINDSLNQLKTLILPLVGKDNSRYSKLEKADILEMTVRFLQELPPIHLQNSSDSYREGYSACMSQLSSLIARNHLLDSDTCGQLLDHLQRCSERPNCQDCSSPKSKDPSHSSRIVPRLNARAEAPSSSVNFQHLHRTLPIHQTSNGFIWRPW
ncbi:transcription factor HES-2 [Microcaecilia unicolor]|uniref:Transcription factor HES-2 n=1 Tax=Microcaecilia unicolor TaxID=1415580 RepID=A0A6P7WKM0_9AMPH|nr:transcription factor HES-2 [Microcaecilia unicolor]